MPKAQEIMFQGEVSPPQYPSTSPNFTVLKKDSAIRYVVGGNVLGGGLSKVYQSYNYQQGHVAALKTARTEQEKQLLKLEKTVLKKIRHPYVPAILGYLESLLIDDSSVRVDCIEISLVKGRSLKGQLNRNKQSKIALTLGESIDIICETANVLEDVYQNHGILHGDLSPDNVLLADEDNHPHIIDWPLSPSVFNRSQKGVAGTITHLAPEILLERTNYTRAAETYALGVMLHELVSGQWLYGAIPDMPNAELQFAFLSAVVLTNTGHTLSQDCPNLDKMLPSDTLKSLEKITQKASTKDPAVRYASPTELAIELKKWKIANQRFIETSYCYS